MQTQSEIEMLRELIIDGKILSTGFFLAMGAAKQRADELDDLLEEFEELIKFHKIMHHPTVTPMETKRFEIQMANRLEELKETKGHIYRELLRAHEHNKRRGE
jgi:hypothetical protein